MDYQWYKQTVELLRYERVSAERRGQSAKVDALTEAITAFDKLVRMH